MEFFICFFCVFLSPCDETPKNAIEKIKGEKTASDYLFLGLRQMYVTFVIFFFTAPLGWGLPTLPTAERAQEAGIAHCTGEVHPNPAPPPPSHHGAPGSWKGSADGPSQSRPTAHQEPRRPPRPRDREDKGPPEK
jgi:hypothetical protein